MHVPSENPEVSSANPGCGRGLPFNDEEFVKDLSLLLVLAGVGTLNQSSSSKEWMQVGGRFHRIVTQNCIATAQHLQLRTTVLNFPTLLGSLESSLLWGALFHASDHVHFSRKSYEN